ncbi:MAG: metallophosphoesterase family protein [Oscillospiraceae bacterium]|nr:metallophosphoesterase family protein [Oscillospiraceae bacterium]
MLKIVHAADLHLDSAFSSLSAEQAAMLRREQRRILEDIAAQAERMSADLLLLSGDLFDSDRCFGETAEALCSAFEQTRAKIFISPGNHDWYSAHSPWARMQLPENVHVFTSPEIEKVELPELGCTVWGSAFMSDSAQPLLEDFHADGAGINIMVLHGDVDAPDSKYGYISREDITASGLDYLALGHVHKFSGVQRAGNTSYAYPGCAMGRGFDETGEKGILCGSVEKGGCDMKFVPLSGRRYEMLRVDISDADDVADAVRQAMPEDCGRDIYRVILCGEHEETPDTAALEGALGGLCCHLEVRDESRPKVELWAAVGENTLKGGFLRRMKALYDAAQTDDERRRVIKAGSYGLAALENREEG